MSKNASRPLSMIKDEFPPALYGPVVVSQPRYTICRSESIILLASLLPSPSLSPVQFQTMLLFLPPHEQLPDEYGSIPIAFASRFLSFLEHFFLQAFLAGTTSNS